MERGTWNVNVCTCAAVSADVNVVGRDERRPRQPVLTNACRRDVEEQGSDTRVRTQKNPVGFFGYTHLKKPTPKKPTLLL